MWINHFKKMHQGSSSTDDGFFTLEKIYKSKGVAKDKIEIVAPTEQIVEQAKLQIKKRKIKDQLS